MVGDFDLGHNLTLKPGQLSYHPEGVYYGPQDDGLDEHVLLVLQCGGASGQGYTSYKTLQTSEKALLETGKTEGGKYISYDGHVIDSYQAEWEHAHGKKLVYPGKRYSKPVVMDPAAYEWTPAHKRPGVRVETTAKTLAWRKTLGVTS